MESLEHRIQRVIREEIAIDPYDPRWSESFQRERQHLLDCLPHELIERIEHFGSTEQKPDQLSLPAKPTF